MIRNVIIGLSILFFALSVIITFKALEIPVKNTRYQNNLTELKSKDLSPKSEDISGQFTRKRADNRASVEELQATIAKLDDKLSNKNEETGANVETDSRKAYLNKTLSIPLKSSPKGARVLLDESQGGFTPLILRFSYISDPHGNHIDETRERMIRVEKKGYKPFVLSFSI